MRDAVAWGLRRARTWVALAAALLATALASGDDKAGWTLTVAVVTSALAAASIRAHWLDTHPDGLTRTQRRQQRYDAMVAASLRRYEGVEEPPVARASRGGVAWAVGRPRTWVALAAAFFATLLASGDGKPGWTVVVGVSTFALAALSVRAHWLDEHPDRLTWGDRRRARFEAGVHESVRRFEEGRPVAPAVPEAARTAAPVAQAPAVPAAQLAVRVVHTTVVWAGSTVPAELMTAGQAVAEPPVAVPAEVVPPVPEPVAPPVALPAEAPVQLPVEAPEPPARTAPRTGVSVVTVHTSAVGAGSTMPAESMPRVEPPVEQPVERRVEEPVEPQAEAVDPPVEGPAEEPVEPQAAPRRRVMTLPLIAEPEPIPEVPDLEPAVPVVTPRTEAAGPTLRRYRRSGKHAAPPDGPFAWSVRRVATWVVLALGVAATYAASRYGALVAVGAGVAAFGLVVAFAWVRYTSAHPDRPDREERLQAKYDAWVEKTLRDYREKPRDAAQRHLRPIGDPIADLTPPGGGDGVETGLRS